MTALAAGLLARALVYGGETAGAAGPWAWSILSLCYIGLGATLVKAGASISLTFAEARFAGRVADRLRGRVAKQLLADGLHDAQPRVLATIAVRLREVESATASGFVQGLRAAAQLVPLALALIFVSPPLAAGAVLALAPFAILVGRLRRRWRAASERAQGLVEELHTGVDALVKNLDLWRSYGAGRQIEAAIAEAGRRSSDASARVEASRAALSGANEVLGALAILGAVVVARQVGIPMGDGRLVAFAAVFFMAYRPLRDLGDARSWLIRGSVAARSIGRVLGRAAPAVVASEAKREWGAGELIAERFGAASRGPLTDLVVGPGELVCVVGPTGSGKTTLLRALLGLEPQVGRLCYAGIPLERGGVGPDARPFAWVPQDAPLITGSVARNVALLGGDETRAHDTLLAIGADRLVGELGDEVVGPGGRSLSGGERRQVAMARALASGLPVLLLDEPTEGLDEEAGQRVLDALKRLRGTRSVVVVTHRPEVRELADRVVPIGAEGLEPTASELRQETRVVFEQ